MRFKLHKAMCEYNCAYALNKTNARDLAISWIDAARNTVSTEPNFRHAAEIDELYSAITTNVGKVTKLGDYCSQLFLIGGEWMGEWRGKEGGGEERVEG